MEKMMDRCGLFGMFDNNGFHTSHLIYYGLFSMQHRWHGGSQVSV